MSDPGEVGDLGRRLAGLSLAERARLFERLRDKKKSEEGASPAAAPLPPLVPRDRSAGPPPLSFAQQRLWFLDRLAPGDAAYNIPTPLAVAGPLDGSRLHRSLAAVVARHESLRTTFRLAGSEPVQEIAESGGDCALPLVDLSALPRERREAEALELRDADAARPFDLAAGPLLRGALLRLEPERHLLLLTLHHIVSDGWSNGVLVRELTTLYGGGTPPDLPIQYADFAVWQRRWLAGEVLAQQTALWRRRLAGMPPALDLPADRPRPPVRSSRGAGHDLMLEPALVLRLKEVARSHGATLFTVLLAVYQALLFRWTGQDDLCVGVPVANRNRREVAGLIGFFVNTLVVRGDLSGDPGLGELLQRLLEVTLEAFEHQDLPFEKLVEELRPQRDPSRSPLVQVLLTLQNTPGAALAAAGLTLEMALPPGRAAKGDLSLSLLEGGDGRLGGGLTYSTDLFDATTMQRFAGHFATLLDAATAQPQRPLSGLGFLSAPETAQLLREWNDTRRPASDAAPPPLHLRFAAQAVATPDAVAAETAGRSLTYRELYGRAVRLARRLAGLGAGPEAVVAVQADRSPELLLGALGVWMAGAAYLPLDPSHPRERRAWALADSHAMLLLAAGDEELPAFSGPVIRFDELGDGAEGAAPPPWHGELDALAYVLYTSGSTGRPKGVMVPHRGLANLAEQMAARTALFAAGPGSRVLLFASPAFDASLLDAALALGTGGTLCLAPGRELPGLASILRERAVTHLHLPPSALAALGEGGPPDGLACVILGGEPCPAPLAALWGSGRRLFNDYGPTEATVFATVDELGEPGQGPLTTGRPIARAEAHLLDRRLHPVPIGVAGEICLAGAGLARGYLGRPDLTAERFVPHPCAGPEERGARLYRTGDLARRLADGRLDYLGRIDRQVKVRGVRIELGEIEAVLLRHPEVREAAVLAQRDGTGTSLAAWIAPAEPAGLRAFLREALPAPAVPAAIFAVDRLPLTTNGKVDREALARRDPAGAASATVRGEEAPPRNVLEQAVAGVWCEVLGLPAVSRNDNFFDLGGHSLLLARVQARLGEVLQREIPLLKLFEHPAVESLAAWLDGTAAQVRPDADHQRRAQQQRQGLELQRRRSAGRGAPR